MAGNTDGGTAVGDTRAEVADVASLVATSKTKVIVITVNSNVLVVPLGQLLDGLLDGLHSSGLTHGLGRVVGMAASTIPVTLEWLGVEGDLDAPLLGNTDKEVAGHPEVVTHGDTLTGTNLELPLRRHHLCIDTANVNAGVETSTVVSLDEVTGEDLASS